MGIFLHFFPFLGIFLLIRKGWTFLKDHKEDIEKLQKIWHHLSYPWRIAEKRKILRKKLHSLGCQKDDICQTLEQEEFRSGKKRKREVDDWIGNVERLRNNVEDLEQKIGGHPLAPWLENSLDWYIREVEELSEQGRSFDDLFLDVPQTRGEIFVTKKLIRPASEADPFERTWTRLTSNEVQRIGIYGVGGVGKTAVMMGIHDKFIENRLFDNVYWVAVSSELNIFKLQNEIAKLAGIDLSGEEDALKRKSKLHWYWGRKRCALFLDDLPNGFEEEEIGNPTQFSGNKLIISTRQKRVCQRIRCQETIQVDPLPDREAEILFKATLGHQILFSPEVEEIAQRIVQNCGGLPAKIIRTAETMRGVDDIHEWQNTLDKLEGN